MYRRRHPLRPHPRRHYHRSFPIHVRKAAPSDINLSDRVEEVRLLCREISSAVSNVEKWMNAIYNVSQAVQDKGAFREMLSAISTLEFQDQLEELKDIPSDEDD